MSSTILNIHDAVLLSISFQSLSFVVLLLIAKRDRIVSDYFLAGFFLAQAAIPLHLLVTYGDVVRDVALASSPDLIHLFRIAYWIEGPLLLWYTRSLLYREFALQKFDFILPWL